MDDVFRRKPARRCNNGLPGREPIWVCGLPYSPAFFQYLWSASVVDRSIDAATAHKCRIGRVNYGIDGFLRQIADFGYHTSVQE